VSIRARYNFSDQAEKRKLFDSISPMEGEYRVEIVRYRARRSDRQNRWYWPAFVEPFADWLSETQGQTVDPHVAHSIFKETFLRVCVTDADGAALFDAAGDPLMRTRSTTELSTTRFNQYLDECGKLMVDLRVLEEMPDPTIYHEREAA
jgi:hypothetical protein